MIEQEIKYAYNGEPTLCKSCNCMTKSIDERTNHRCGKCGGVK